MRLTKKNENGTYSMNLLAKGNGFDAYDKLGQLEDIEEELGIDLVTLFKALKDGVCAKNTKGEIINLIEYERPSLSFDENDQRWCFVLDSDICKALPHHYLYLIDYDKTWALTREELK